MLGGSSAQNWALYTRGSDVDFDNWAALADDPSWSANELRSYFRKHQTLDPIADSVKDREFTPLDYNSKFHGKEGPIHTSFNTWNLPLANDFLRACHVTAGREAVPRDPWSGDHLGFYSSLGAVDTSHCKGTRSYSASSYLQPNLNRPNLKVLTEAAVTKVLIDDRTKEARAVEFEFGQKKYIAQAQHEIILSCGVVQSPQILELSGIGDRDILRAAGVDCLIELPAVGENLQDHPGTMIEWRLAPGVKSLDVMGDPDYAAKAQEEYVQNQSGLLSTVNASMGFLPYCELVSKVELQRTIEIVKSLPSKTRFQAAQREQVTALLQSPTHASIHFVLSPASLNLSAEAVADQRNVLRSIGPTQLHGATASICVSNSVGRGSSHIQSSDPSKHPRYDQGFFENEADVAIAMAGLRFLDRVAKSEGFRHNIAEREYPPPEVDMDNDKAVNEYVHSLCISEYHPVGTCAMSQVVDNRLKVKGAKRLRVVDASVFPNHVSGNPMSAVYALAEKASDLIKKDRM